MRFRILLFCLIVFSSCNIGHVSLEPELEDALVSLDQALDNSDIYARRKEIRIDSLQRLIPFAEGRSQLYDIYDSLFDEYEMWNSDSAFFYAHRKELLARTLNDSELINDAAADISSRYITSSMYQEALDVILNANSITGSFFLNDPRRDLLLYEIYHNLVLSFSDKYAQSEFLDLEDLHLERAVRNIDKNEINYFIFLSKSMIAEGKSGQLVIILRNKLDDDSIGVHDKAIVNWWMGKAYETMGDARNSFLRYVLSAREDLECANREYGSLIKVAQLCYDMGMTERAYRYIRRCYEDALAADARRRLKQIGESLYDIGIAYEQISQKQKSIIVFLNISLLLFLLMLLAAIVMLIVNNNKLTRANKAINDNMKIIDEATRTNEVYLGHFFSMFSNHIDALERYRSRLRVLAKRMDMDAMQQELRSNKFINEELSNLYDVFDKTFLGLFPTFIEQLNELLRPEGRIQTDHPGGKLSNEIRVLALIKLGMTESRHIAQFLRLSTTTVFNYRVKYRNAAINGREKFEESLNSIHL